MKFQTIEELDDKLRDFRILFAYNSNKIENNSITYHDTREIFEKGRVISFTGELKTLFEIENQKHCYDFLKEKIINKDRIDVELIKTIHYKLTKGTYDEYRYNINGERPGEFKKHDYVTGINEVGSRPENVEQDLMDLLQEINSYNGKDHITVAAYLHAAFENIHPFADGNGRVGRTLLNYYLMIHDIDPIIIYEEDKKMYYNALEKFDQEDSELTPLIDFILYEQKKTWSKKENRQRNQSLNKCLDQKVLKNYENIIDTLVEKNLISIEKGELIKNKYIDEIISYIQESGHSLSEDDDLWMEAIDHVLPLSKKR